MVKRFKSIVGNEFLSIDYLINTDSWEDSKMYIIIVNFKFVILDHMAVLFKQLLRWYCFDVQLRIRWMDAVTPIITDVKN